jgi:hypothetical protein
MSSRNVRNFFDALRADRGLPPRLMPSAFVATITPGDDPPPPPAGLLAAEPTSPSTPTSGPAGPGSS